MTPETILEQYFGYTTFRSRQREVIECVLANQNALVIMPTGMGKSVCYQIPALHYARTSAESKPLTLVLSPLIALMKDQVDALVHRNISATYINSSLSKSERESRYVAIAKGTYSLLYVTPERFRKSEFLDALASRHIPLLALDEAHCVSEWGHDFRPDYSRVGEIREKLGVPTTIALTATATPDVQQDILKQLDLTSDEVTTFHEGIDRPNLRLEVEPVWDDDDKLQHLLRIDAEPHLQDGSGIVYFTLIRTLERFSDLLARRGVSHLCYHGDLGRQQRKSIQSKFMKGDCRIVLATNAFGMGIDKENIRYVTHAEVPGSMESYYQEIGRAGRDGLPSVCTLLYSESDLATQMEFLGWSNPDADFYESLYELLTTRNNEVQAFGNEWLGEQLVAQSRYDHRLETAFAMFDRHGVVQGKTPPECYEVTGLLPEYLVDRQRLAEKLQRAQQKLYALVQYVNCTEGRKQFIHAYFGIPMSAASPEQ